MRLLRGVLLCLALAGTAHAAISFPALTGRVVDGAQLLSPATEQQLTAQLETLEAQTHAQFVVVTVPSLNGQEIEEYGYQLGRHWGIGQKGKNNGVLLIVAPKERRVRIEVGYGLEGVLTDAASSWIIQGIILPEFKRGSMEQGIVSGANAVATLVKGGSLAELDAHSEDSSESHMGMLLFFAIWMIIVFSQLVLFLIYLPLWVIGKLLELFSFKWLLNFLRRQRDRIVPKDKPLLVWLLTPSGRFTGSGGGSFRSGGGGGGFSGGGGSFGGGGSSGRW